MPAMMAGICFWDSGYAAVIGLYQLHKISVGMSLFVAHLRSARNA